MTTYLGFPVLTIEPVREPRTPEEQRAASVSLDAGTGPSAVAVQDARPGVLRELTLAALDQGAAADARAFLEPLRGQQGPFWAPSWQRDLTLAGSYGSGSATIGVLECGYATRLFPLGPARRHLAMRAPGGALTLRRVIAATSDGTTETLTLEGPNGEATLGVAVSPTWLVMLLRFVRLDADEIPYDWEGPLMRCGLRLRELNAEVPA